MLTREKENFIQCMGKMGDRHCLEKETTDRTQAIPRQ